MINIKSHIKLLLIFLTIANMSTAQNKIIYIGDPMCSWCYGIANEIDAVKSHFQSEIKFETIMGGLRPYNKQTMIELKEFLMHHWGDVNKASGQEFNYGILDDKELAYDTEPPSRAIICIRQMAPEKEFEFFHEVQKLFYKQNKNMFLVESYKELIEDLNLDFIEFKKMFNSDLAKQTIAKDFERANNLGVHSFPTILLSKNGEIQKIASGFITKEKMIERINKELNKY